ncbi:hypothetical protein DOTSEDRAFT_50986 [Dothistroma septosporum NZE10]|uniref:Uncharacterized protein n=1 Tax=Dothistroma septosporum (strain NZE10 / CBS 128990) TaxID=675120 RepID=N1PZ38_DOTSN|nr:hypothetical protein DOTSEDRAFT_50986 [Dothistroma septosporum NZE10]
MAAGARDEAPTRAPCNLNDGDLDPASFLRSVRELSDRRDREDEERFKKLEEEVQQQKEQRAARRAERVRSISPAKSAQSSTPTHRLTTNVSLDSSRCDLREYITAAKTPMEPNTSPTKDTDVPEFKGFGSVKRSSTSSSNRSSTIAKDADSAPAPSATNLARSGTLSWQQRPRSTSRIAGTRPQSMLSQESKPVAEQPQHTRKESKDEPEPSRVEIAASLNARDPSWFKQTAEQGVGSAAYRKSKDEMPHADNVFSGSRVLPGMSGQSLIEPERCSPPASDSAMSLVSRGGSIRSSTLSNGSRYSSPSTSSGKADLRSLIAADEDQQKAFEQSSTTSGDFSTVARTLTMSTSQARLTHVHDRSASPTKGMGGFVQSAMMKRSDSQNKRWSAQPSTGLSRNNSVASARGGLGGLQGSQSMPRLEPTPDTQERDKEGQPWPTSSSNDLTSLATSSTDNDGFVKPALPRHHSRSKSVASNYSTAEDTGVPHSPGSPSKRYSPTKSSWLESSITRPESPKQLAPSKNATPSWMADLAKAKAQRASADLTFLTSGAKEDVERLPSKPGSPTKDTPFGPALLKRAESKDAANNPRPTTPTNKVRPLRLTDKFTSSPAAVSAALKPGANGSHIDGQPEASTESVSTKPLPTEHEQLDRITGAYHNPKPPILEEQTLIPTNDVPDVRQTAKVPSTEVDKPTLAQEPSATAKPWHSQTLGAPPETEPEVKPDAASKAPISDFRSQLKSRPRAQTKSKEEPEFLAKFGQLRKAQQEKFVAPDVLKDNILRGKSGLAVTGGPVKTARKDELKQSLQARKDDIKKAKEEGRDLPGRAHERKTSSVAQPIPPKPEALARRELLSRSDSGRSIPDRAGETTPEALSRHRSLKQKPSPEHPVVEVAHAEVKVEQLPKQIGIEKSSTMPAELEAKFQPLSKEISEPSAVEIKQSKLAARFNPGLASMLARGPPSATPSRPESPATPGRVASPAQTIVSEPSAAGAPLQDVRKDRAKGPKRRKGFAKTESPRDATSGAQDRVAQNNVTATCNQEDSASENGKADLSSTPAILKHSALAGPVAPVVLSSLCKSSSPRTANGESNVRETEQQPPIGRESMPSTKRKPQALSGSATAVLGASLGKRLSDKDETSIPDQISTPVKGELLNSLSTNDGSKDMAAATTTAVPEFKGFGSAKSQRRSPALEDDKENAGSPLPSVKTAASRWGRRPMPEKKIASSQIELPSRKDDHAAMRSAGLLASSPQIAVNNGPGTSVDKAGNKTISTPPASAGLPPKPAKSSRVVSGQLAEASPNKGSENTSATGSPEPRTVAGRLLIDTFGTIPKYHDPLAINTSAVIADSTNSIVFGSIKTVRKSVLLATQDGAFQGSAQAAHEDYVFFSESIYACTHVFTTTKGMKSANVYLWIGDSASETAVEVANGNARRIARDNMAPSVQLVRQGRETAQFLQAMGGIFVTRIGTRDTAPKQYMLLGRKHLGHIVFDEMGFGVDSLCGGFVYLISYPVTLQDTKLYLWKGQGCSAEELSASRLAAMDMSETGEIIEVDGGAEFPSFLKIFGPGTSAGNVPQPSELWQQKASAPDKFKTRLFRIQQTESRTGLLTSLWNRRPSWNRLSPARSPARDQDRIEVEAKEIHSVTQAQLDAEGCYLLDASSELYVLLGPLHASQLDKVRNAILGQTLLFASDYAIMVASMEDRRTIPKCSVLFSGVPRDVKLLFRHWDESQGLWGTASLMAGSTHGSGEDLRAVPLNDLLTEVCRN